MATKDYITRSRIHKRSRSTEEDRYIVIPRMLSRPLVAADFTAVEWYVTEEGLLLVPVKEAGPRSDVELPFA